MDPRRSYPVHAEPGWLLPHPDTGERPENAENAEEPQDNRNDHNGIQDRFDGARHWYETVDEPEKHTDHDQDHHHLN